MRFQIPEGLNTFLNGSWESSLGGGKEHDLHDFSGHEGYAHQCNLQKQCIDYPTKSFLRLNHRIDYQPRSDCPIV